MSKILNFIIENETIDQQTKKKLEALSQLFEAALPLSLQIEDVRRLDVYDIHLPAAIEKLSHRIRDDLFKLEEGEKLLIPHGWSSVETGHATILVCTRAGKGFVFEEINTGSGAQYHLSQRTGTKVYIETVHSFFLPQAVIEEGVVIQQILAPLLLGTGTKDHRDRRFEGADLYVVLQPYELTKQQQMELAGSLSTYWMGTQLSGTCSFACLEAMIASNIGKTEYKHFLPLVKEQVLMLTLDLNEDLLKFNPPLAKILSEATPRTFSRVAKSIERLSDSSRTDELLGEKSGQLDKLAEFHRGLLEELPSRISSNPPIACSAHFPSKTGEVLNGLSGTDRAFEGTSISKTVKIKTEVLPSFDFEKIETAEQLLSVLKDYAAYQAIMKNAGSPSDMFTGIFLRNIGRIFTQSPERRVALLVALEKDPGSSKIALEELEQIVSIYYEETGKKTEIDGSRLIALYSALAAGWCLGVSVDKQANTPVECSLSNYYPNRARLLSKVFHDHVNHLASPELLQDWALLLKFMESTIVKGGKPLFNFDRHGQMQEPNKMMSPYNYVFLDTVTGDYDYAKAHISLIPEEEWKESTEEYAKQVKKYPNYAEPDATEWKANWLYVKGKLPEHFLNLRHIAIMAHIESPNNDSTGRWSQFELTGPSIIPKPNTQKKELMITFSYDATVPAGTEARLILAPKKVDEGSMLPGDRGKLHFNIPQGMQKPYNFAWIFPHVQNEILTEALPGFHELLALRTPFSRRVDCRQGKLPLAMLIDYFGENLHELAKIESRIIFDTCFNQINILRTVSSNTPVLKEIEGFFNSTIGHFFSQVLANQDLKQSMQALLFLYEQKQRFLRFRVLGANGSDAPQISAELSKISAELSKTREELNKLREHPLFSDPLDQQYLCLIILDSYNGGKDLSSTEVAELIKTRADLARLLLDSPQTTRLFNSLWRSAEASPMIHKDNIQRELGQNPAGNNALFNPLLEQMGVNVHNGEWKEEVFPLYTCMQDGILYQINVLTGDIRKNGNSFSPLKDLSRDSLYQEVFGNVHLKGTQTGTTIESQDVHGNIRLQISKTDWGSVELKAVHREIVHQWYQYSQKKPALPPFPEIANLKVWKGLDNESAGYLLVDKTTMVPHCVLDDQGYFHFPYGINAKRYEWVDISSVEGMEGAVNFDSKAFIWKPAPVSSEETYPAVLVFPSYRDEQGNPLKFELKDGKWVSKASPHLSIASEQEIHEITGFSRFLVLEDSSGEKEVLLPTQSLRDIKAKSSSPSICQRMKLESGQASSRIPYKNAFLAYLSLAHAITPQDYVIAMEYLKNAFSFQRYSPEELRILGWIFNVVKDKPDHTGSMDAIRLYAAWLVHDNLKRNPPLEVPSKKQGAAESKTSIPSFSAKASDWEAYWKEEWTWTSKGSIKTHTSQVDKLTRHYLARRTNVPYQLRLENILEPQVLINWGFDRRVIGASGITSPAHLPGEEGEILLESLNLFKISNRDVKTPLSFQMRPGNEFAEHFSRLYQIARSSDSAGRESVQSLVNSMAYDTFKGNQTLRVILKAAILAGQSDTTLKGYQQALSLVKYMDTILVELRQGSGNMAAPSSQRQATHALNDLLKSFNSQIAAPKRLRGRDVTRDEAMEPAEIIPTHEPLILPNVFPRIQKLGFDLGHNDLKELNEIYSHIFETGKKGDAESEIKVFEFKTEDEFIQTGLHELNEDYIAGVKKNAEAPWHTLKEGVDLKKTVSGLKSGLAEMQAKNRKDLKNRHIEMIDLANTPSESSVEMVLEKAAVLAGLKPPLNEKDCIALFLLGDLNEFKKKTHLTDEGEIKRLYQMIGEYITLSRKTSHIDGIARDVADLDKLLNPSKESSGKEIKVGEPKEETAIQAEVDALLQKIGNGLNMVRHVDPAVDPAALLVLENGLNLFLKKDQVEGLRKMTPSGQQTDFPNVLLQRIQGGGKTLVFGHTLALQKADGYHLSIHVVPTAQYGTALYDMQHVSGKVFGQRERTLEFDDNPQRFTVEYLSWMKDTMTGAVVNREYITVTNETLRAMRCKYIKMRLIINEKLIASNGEVTAEIRELEASNDILKEMLTVLKERGVFTFDEVHQAFNPKKELNMPFGNITPIDFTRARLMGKIIAFAAHARTSQDALLQLHENRQSQQTDEQYEAMLKVVADKFINDPKIKEELGLSDNETEMKQLKAYLLGSEENLPAFIEDKGKEKAVMIVLAKQMLAGKWLKDRLGKSIDEHHGFSLTQNGPRIAIPYIANNSPSEGSEFSDAYVMIINTFMTYIAQGLTYGQLQEFVDDLKDQAYMERLNRIEEDPGFALKDTVAAQQFFKVCGMDLFMIDKDDPSTLQKINQALLADKDEAALFLFDYVIAHVFPKVEIYDHQVCSHGRNTAAMAQSFLGYSGSLDNPNLAPPGSTILPEKGTNGQTVDLFIRQNNEWWVVDSASSSGSCSLIADLYEKHPDRSEIGAIIDVGSYFRGIPNKKVAEMICQSLVRQESPRAGVLFFDPANGSLYFMNKAQPAHPLRLSGTRPEIILKETGYTPDELFVYYDQDHITGIDIALGKKTKAIITWSEHTKIHDALQGGRRLRELDLQQRLISAVEQGALSKIGSKLHKPSLAELQKGRVDPKKNSIQDLLLFSHLNEHEEVREENMLFCLHDMGNTLQQYALDMAYKSTKEKEREIFAKTSSLFVKDIAVDLYKEYAYKRESMPVGEYLAMIQNQLMTSFSSLLSAKEIEDLSKILTQMITNSLNGLKKTVDVGKNFKGENGLSLQGAQDGTTTQFREQKQTSEKKAQNVQDNQSLQEQFTNNELNVFNSAKTAEQIKMDVKIFGESDLKISKYNEKNGCLNSPEFIFFDESGSSQDEQKVMEIWGLDQALSVSNKFDGMFDQDILVTSNFAIAWEGRIDLLGGFSKIPFQWLLIGDETLGKKAWKLILVSVEDAANLSINWNTMVLPEGRSMYLVRSFLPIKCLESKGGEFDARMFEEDRQLRKLAVLSFFFSGKLRVFNNRKWRETLDEILPQGEGREPYRKFFEEQVLRGLPPAYLQSPLYKVLHKDKDLHKAI